MASRRGISWEKILEFHATHNQITLGLHSTLLSLNIPEYSSGAELFVAVTFCNEDYSSGGSYFEVKWSGQSSWTVMIINVTTVPTNQNTANTIPHILKNSRY